MRNLFIGIALFIVVSLGVFLRIQHLNEDSLWLDEGITYYNSSAEDLKAVWNRVADLDQSPPGYYFLMHLFFEHFGESEVGVRLVSVIFGVLSILLLFWLLTEIFDAPTGLTGAALLAVNPFHIGFSMEARMYVLLGLLALGAFLFLYRAMLRDGRRYFDWLFFTLFAIAGVYTHTFFFFILAGLAPVFVVFLIPAEKKIAKILMGTLSASLLAVAYLPWLPNLLKQLQVERYWLADNSLGDVSDYFLQFVDGQDYVLYVGLALIFAGILWSFFDKEHQENEFELAGFEGILTFVVFSFGVPLVYSLITEPILKVRYMVFLLPFLLGLSAVGLNWLRKIHWSMILIPLLALIYLWTPWTTSDFPEEFGEDFRGMVWFIEKDPLPVIVHTPSAAHVINFYNDGTFKTYPFPDSDDLREFNVTLDYYKKYREYAGRFEEFYLVTTHTHEQPPGFLVGASHSLCSSSETFTDFEGIDLFKFSGCGR